MNAIASSQRLVLTPFAERHLSERYVGWLNDPETMRYSEQRHRRHTLDSCRDYWQRMRAGGHCFWAIEAKDPALGHVGNMTAYVDAPNRVANLAILIGDRRIWGRGYGTEAWRAACGHLLGPAGMRKVVAATMAKNVGMVGIMRASGMTEEGRRRDHYLLDGQPIDEVQAAIFGR
ncbi:MAG: GNAT family N-acetyltransferase [Alphaproteobacteria bacterium]|nr:GNAT family N-acetyltransferase [Alphaproteobacteria bacterium]